MDFPYETCEALELHKHQARYATCMHAEIDDPVAFTQTTKQQQR